MELLHKNTENLKEYINLHSADQATVLQALERIRESGNIHYLNLLFEMLLSDPPYEIRKEILSMLGSVKLKQSASLFIEAINDSKYLKIRKELLMACWQSDLDFTPYYPELIQIIIDSDWETAFEAFTIIENSDYLPDSVICTLEAEKIKNLSDQPDEMKKYLLNALLGILIDGEKSS